MSSKAKSISPDNPFKIASSSPQRHFLNNCCCAGNDKAAAVQQLEVSHTGSEGFFIVFFNF
jgi:hypothetical protein